MKHYIIALILLLTISMTSCSPLEEPIYPITYDNMVFFTQQPPSEAKAGETIQLLVAEDQNVNIFLNGAKLNFVSKNDSAVVYEFVMPAESVYIQSEYIHDEESSDHAPITMLVPAQFNRFRITGDMSLTPMQARIIETNEAFQDFIQAYSFYDANDAEDLLPMDLTKHKLIVFQLTENSGTITHTLKSVELTGNVLTISISKSQPDMGTCDIANYLCVVPVSKALVPTGCSVSIVVET